ncbi:unnamed protein product [Rodentolepis nana]|uniref:Secreted peptide n=1 Tax=Rodentolepis nana TaxID=102285 RepID=A0A0R3TPI1_RODNA|nr:unnamed protein product [Rodentolepis nana]
MFFILLLVIVFHILINLILYFVGYDISFLIYSSRFIPVGASICICSLVYLAEIIRFIPQSMGLIILPFINMRLGYF